MEIELLTNAFKLTRQDREELQQSLVHDTELSIGSRSASPENLMGSDYCLAVQKEGKDGAVIGTSKYFMHDEANYAAALAFLKEAVRDVARAPLQGMTASEVAAAFPAAPSGALREKLNRPNYDLVPFEMIEAYARVADFGARKYAPRNWERGLPSTQIASSLIRHLWAWMQGEDLDSESGLSHIDHVVWNAGALAYNGAHPELSLDNRTPRASAQKGTTND